jgi:hypothetical protein
MSNGTPPSLSLSDLQAACTGTFRERFYNCMKILGLLEIRFLASVGVDPAVLSRQTATQPLVPLIHVQGWHQPFVRDMVGTPALPQSSTFFEPQDLRDALVDPGSALPVRQLCGDKAVFEIVWSLATAPDVVVSGQTFESTPLSGFSSGGTPFSVTLPDATRSTGPQATADFSFEFGYRLAEYHFQGVLPDECHAYAVMESFGVNSSDIFIKHYFKAIGN